LNKAASNAAKSEPSIDTTMMMTGVKVPMVAAAKTRTAGSPLTSCLIVVGLLNGLAMLGVAVQVQRAITLATPAQAFLLHHQAQIKSVLAATSSLSDATVRLFEGEPGVCRS